MSPLVILSPVRLSDLLKHRRLGLKAEAGFKAKSADPSSACITPPQAPPTSVAARGLELRTHQPCPSVPSQAPAGPTRPLGTSPGSPQERPWTITSTPPVAASSSLPLHRLIKRPKLLFSKLQFNFMWREPIVLSLQPQPDCFTHSFWSNIT